MSISDINIRVGMDATEVSAACRRASVDVRSIEKSMAPANMSMRRMRTEARRLYLDTRTPLERYTGQVESLTHMHQKGVISDDLHRRGIEKAGLAYRQATKDQAGLTKGTDRLSQGFSSLARTALIWLGPAALVMRTTRSIAQAFTELDVVAKTARTVGISGQALMEFQHAAKITGMEVEQVNKAIQFLSRRVGEAVEGFGEGRRAFDILGLDPRQLAAMGNERALLKVADAFAQIEDPTKKAAVATQLFERSGYRMINLLDLGEEGLRKYAAEFRDLAGITTDIDLAKIEEGIDDIQRMATAWKGAWREMAISMAPVVSGVAELVAELGKVARTGSLTLPGIAEHILAPYRAQAEERLKALRGGELLMQERMRPREMAAAGKQRTELTEADIEAMEKQADAIEKAEKANADLRRELSRFRWTDRAKALGEYADKLREANVPAEDMNGLLRERNKLLEIQDKQKQQEELADSMEKAREKLADMRQELRQVGWSDQAKGAYAFANALQKAGASAETVKAMMQRFTGLQQATAAKSWADELQKTEDKLRGIGEKERLILDAASRVDFQDPIWWLSDAGKKLVDLENLYRRMKELEQVSKDMAAADAIRKQFADPIDDAKAKIADLLRLVSVGALDARTASQAIAAETTKRLEAITPSESKEVGQIRTGSLAARRLEAQHERFMREAPGIRGEGRGATAAAIQAEQQARLRTQMQRAIPQGLAFLKALVENTDPNRQAGEQPTHISLAGY